MNKLTQSKKFNPNYAAQIVELKTKHVHPNADRLSIWKIQGCNVITDNVNYAEGDIVVFFPVECQINKDFLSFLSLYRDKILNKTDSVGFFEPSSRVKALKLRNTPSEGFIIKLSSFIEFFGEIQYNIGDVFDSVDDIQVCKKYIIKEHNVNSSTRKERTIAKHDIVEDQFRFHYDTEKLVNNEFALNQGDICVISSKWHGTSLVSSKLLTKRKLSILEKIVRLLGVKTQESEYQYIFSSRKVIKNVGQKSIEGQSYYEDDIWGLAHDKIKHTIKNGMSLYCEIVGYLPSGKMIQDGYDYGCKMGEFKVLVYRITTTNDIGNVYEWDWASIKNYCNKYEIEHVPEYYYGPINFTIEQLKEKYLEKDCQYCINHVPDEGICFRNESLDKKAYKMKSFRFLERESKTLDKGVVDTESQESYVEV